MLEICHHHGSAGFAYLANIKSLGIILVPAKLLEREIH